MAYRNIFITNEARLKLKNNQLIVFNGEELSFPIEDIRSIVIDNPYTSLTGKLITRLANDGVCLIICDEKHTPSCELSPIGAYCRMNKRINLQFSQSKPKLKKIWQKTVQAKICNQAKCLEINEIDEAKTLFAIAKMLLRAIPPTEKDTPQGFISSRCSAPISQEMMKAISMPHSITDMRYCVLI